MTFLSYYQSSSWRNLFRTLAIACFFCCSLIVLRVVWFRQWMYLFLVWNLFLAGLPLVFAFYWRFYLTHFQKGYLLKGTLLMLWLLFFPNAPYIITDLIHLSAERAAPLWFDAAIVFCSALTGLMMGLTSLYLIHEAMKKTFNTVTEWIVLAGLIVLSSYGIYLGRVLRWNSWDVVARPLALIRSMLHSFYNPSAIAMTLVFSAMLSLAYLLFYHLLEQKQKAQ